MTEARRNAVRLLMDCLDATKLNRYRLAKLARIWHGAVYNAANGCTVSEYNVERMKRVLYEHLMLRQEDLSRDLDNVNRLLAKIERDELKGMCEYWERE